MRHCWEPTSPSPPDDVPELNTRRSKKRKQSIREALAEHRNNASCATCHKIIDPIGFGLENYDFLGRWRDEDQGIRIDASASMPDGTRFSGPAELKKILLKQKDQFVRHLAGKVLGYAIGRSLTDHDAGTIEKIVRRVKQDDYSSRSMIKAVVTSTPFLMRQKTISKNKE